MTGTSEFPDPMPRTHLLAAALLGVLALPVHAAPEPQDADSPAGQPDEKPAVTLDRVVV